MRSKIQAFRKEWKALLAGAAKALFGSLVSLTMVAAALPAGGAGFSMGAERGDAATYSAVASPALRTSASLRGGALATASLDLVGLELSLPSVPMKLPQNAPFYVPVTLSLGGHPAPAAMRPAGTTLSGTLTGPGLSGPISVEGSLQAGLSMPGLPQAGDYTLSNVQLNRGSQLILSAKQPAMTITCLGEILLSSVTSTPMTMQEIKEAGISLQPGDYIGRRFEMVLAVGGQQVSLSVPIAIPVYNGLESVMPSTGPERGLQIGNLGGQLMKDLSVVIADLQPPEDPFRLSRPALSFKMRNGFKALLVIPGSIGYLKQLYRVNVVVFNVLEEGSPFKISHLSAQWVPPAGADGKVGTDDDPLTPMLGESLTQDLLGPDGSTPSIAAGESAKAVFEMFGNREGSHPLDFKISGQFEGGGLDQPVAITGVAQGKVLVQNPNFNLMLAHPDVVRRGQTYTLEAHLTNTSQALANAVSITIDKARLAGAQLVGEATQLVDTLLPGETTVMKFQLQALISGKVTSSYLYIDPGNTIGFQLSTGIGPRSVALNPDTLALPESLDVLPKPLREAMLALLNAAYDVATSQKALPPGVLPISRSAITNSMAQSLSQEGLFLGMGIDRTRVWQGLWNLFMNHPDPGFDQLVRTTPEGARLRTALLDAWQAWPVSDQGPAELLPTVARYGDGIRNQTVVAIQAAAPGLSMNLLDAGGVQVSGVSGADPTLALAGSAWGASTDGALQWAQLPIAAGGLSEILLRNGGQSPQTLKVAILHPVAGRPSPAVNLFDVTLNAGSAARFRVGDQASARASLDGNDLWPTGGIENLESEPFQVLGVHRYDLSVSGSADPYGTQVMVLFNRPNMPLHIPNGDAGFQTASSLIQVEANRFWQKVLAPSVDSYGGPLLDGDGRPVIPPAPAALLQAFPRVVSCYLEKPVGPYVQRRLTLSPQWKDQDNNALGGSLQWPIQSGLLPGGSIVKGHFRKLDGTGLPGNLTYWYGQQVNDGGQIDLATGFSFMTEYIESYYPLITSHVPTEADGSYQLDYVPAPIGDSQGPFVLQGGFPEGTAFAQASVLGNGGTIQMDLVLDGKGSVDGYVVDAQGQPIAGAQIMGLQEQRSSDFTQGTGGGRFSVGGTTDAGGHYHLDGLKTGIFSLQVLKGELGAVGGGQISTDGQTVSVNVVLQGKVGTVRARVLGPDGRVRLDQAVRMGMPGGLVRSAGSSGTWIYPEEQAPGVDGWATFTKVPAGDLRLLAPYAAPTPAAPWQGFLDPGQTLQVELRMVEADQLANVRAHVTDAAGHPVQGAYFRISTSDHAGYSAQTGVDGYSDPVKAIARPWVPIFGTIYHPNWSGQVETNSLFLQPGGSFVLEAVLPLQCTVSGQVTRPDGTVVAGAYVAIPPVYNDTNKNRLSITDKNGRYSLPNVPVGAAYRLAAIGPELLTYANLQISIGAGDANLRVNLTLPAVAHNRITGQVYQPLVGNGQRIPTNGTVIVRSSLPDVSPLPWGNSHWGLPEDATTGGVLESDMPPTRVGQFSISNLPAGPYTITANSALFPGLVEVSGDFGVEADATRSLDVFLQDNHVGTLLGKVRLADGQTPVAPGARVMVMAGGKALVQVLTQPGGTYAFPKVIPPSADRPYVLRVEDPQTGQITAQPFSLAAEEVKILNLRLWGKGNLTVDVQDSAGNPMLCQGTVTCGTVTLQHSKAGLVTTADMPLLQLPLTPSDKGSLLFPNLLEGPITIELKDPSGFSGLASASIPEGGGDQRVVVRLQPVGSIQGTLLRADGTPVAAGRIDAYQGGRWLGTAPTFMQFPADASPVQGHFMFNPLPTGAIRLEAWDPDSRQVGRATVLVQEGQVTSLTMATLDTGTVTIQVLQEGQPVLRAGINVTYSGGPALSFSTQATANESGIATFILPPGTYQVQAADPVSLASGTLEFTRGINDPPLSLVLTIKAVRSVYVTALAPVGAPNLSLGGWRVLTSPLNRGVILDANGQGTLDEMPVGTYRLQLQDAQGRTRGTFTYQVTQDGGVLQTAQIQAMALGQVQVTVVDAGGQPVAGASVSQSTGGSDLLTDPAGQVLFLDLPQGTVFISANHGSQRASGATKVDTEGQRVSATLTFAPTASLHGVVRDPLNQPVAFVAVSCGGGLPETATDANGRFAFQGLPISRALTVVVRNAEGRTGTSQPITLAQGDDPEVDLSLSAMGKLIGQISDPLRPTLPPLQVQVLGANGTVVAAASTDQTGAFQMTSVPADLGLTLRVLWDDGSTVALQQSVSLSGEGQALTLNLQLPPFVNITGWTLDAASSNQPMYVQLLDDQGHLVGRATTTVDIPTFYFRYLKAGDAYQLTGLSEDNGAAIALLAFSPTGQSVIETRSIQVVAWPTLRLQLRYPDGTPAAGGHATAVLQGTSGLALGHSWAVVFDPSGAATIPSMPPGCVRMTVNDLPWQGPSIQDITIPNHSGELAVSVLVKATASLALQLRYPDGTAAPGFGVQIRLTGLGETGSGVVSGAFEASGQAMVTGLPVGQAHVQVSGLPWQGDINLAVNLLSQGQTYSQDVAITGVGTLSVRLHTVLAPGHDVTQAQVVYLRNGSSYPLILQPDGTFSLKVPMGEPLSVQVAGYVAGKVFNQTFGTIAQNGGISSNTFGLPALGRIHGRVLGADGQPRPGVPVQLADGGVLQTVSSDGSGTYAFEAVQVGQPMTVVAQDPVIAPVSASLTLSQEGQDLAQDLTLKGFATLSIHFLRVDGSAAAGLTISMTGGRVSRQGVSDAAGRVVFSQVLPDISWTISAPFSTGTVTQYLTLVSSQNAILELKETPRTRLSGRVRRQAEGQTWPQGATLQVWGAAYATLTLHADGTFPDQDLLLNSGTSLQASVQVPGQATGLTLALPIVPVVPGGQTLLDLQAPAFGSLQGQVTLAGNPAVGVVVWLDGRSAFTTDAQGLTSTVPVLTGSHRYQVTAPGGMAWADVPVQTDGQIQMVPLPLQNNAVSLPTNITLEKVGFTTSVGSTRDSFLPVLGFSTDSTATAPIPIPPQGYWIVPGHSLAWEMDQGDIHITRILASSGYGLREQLVFENRGQVPHALNLNAQTGTLRGADPQLGSPNQSGGAWFSRTTVAWGKGGWVPSGMVASSWYSGLDTLVWPALTLAPGQTRSIWLGGVPHGQGSFYVSQTGPARVSIPSSEAAAMRALQRMVGQAPEWLQGLDARLNNQDPTPTITTALPAWDGTASWRLLDPTGQPVQALAAPSPTLTVTPKEALAPISEFNWGTSTRSFQAAFTNVPPDGFGYVLSLPTPMQGDLAQGQTLDVSLGQDWAVAQFSTAANQAGNHRLSFTDASLAWSAYETLVAGQGVRWCTQAGSLSWTLQQQDNSNLQASGSAILAPGALTPIQIQLPAYGSLQVVGPRNLGRGDIYYGLNLTATSGTATVGSQVWTNGGFVFPALPAGAFQIQGLWDLGPVQIQEGISNVLNVDTGAFQVTAVDANGVRLSGNYTVVLSRGGKTQSYYSYYANPFSLPDLPMGPFTVSLQDPVSGALVSTSASITAGSATPVTLQLGVNGSLSITLLTAAGAPFPNLSVVATPGNGSVRYGATDANGFVHMVNLGSGSASLTYGHVAKADASDEPGAQPTLVPLVPGTDVPVTIRVPDLGSVTVVGVTQAGDVLPNGFYTIANAFKPGRRGPGYSNGAFLGVVLGQPLVVRFGDGTNSYAASDASPVTPTVDGQKLALTFPMGRVRVRVLHQDQSLMSNVQVALSFPGLSTPMQGYTDASGLVAFPFVPLGTLLSCTATSGGSVAAASNRLFTGPDQIVDLLFPNTTPLTVHLVRANPAITLNPNGWTWTITPGSDTSAPPSGVLDATFGGLYQGSTQSLSATLYLVDSLGGSRVGSNSGTWSWGTYYPNFNTTWTASLTQAIGAAATEATLSLPVRASAKLVFQDAQGQLLTGSLYPDVLTAEVKQSPNPGIVHTTRYISSLDDTALAEVLTEGTHVLSLSSQLWGALPDVSITVGLQDDGSQLQIPVILDWERMTFDMKAVAGDAITPVVDAHFGVKDWAGNYHGLGGPLPSAADGVLADTDARRVSIYVPRGRQIQVGASYQQAWYSSDGTYHSIATGWVDGTLHGAGSSAPESILLPLTVLRARLTDQDASALDAFAAEQDPDMPLPLVRVQGTLYATLLGAKPGPVTLTLYDPDAGLGATTAATVPPLGQTGAAEASLPAYAWMSQAAMQDGGGNPVTDPLWVAVGADAPGVVKPALAQWHYAPQLDQPWEQLGSPDGIMLTEQGFLRPQSSWFGTPLTRVRVPLQGSLWIGSDHVTNTHNGDGMSITPGGYGVQVFSLNADDSFSPSIQVPVSTWAEVPVTVQDGRGNPYAQATVTASPLHGPQGWSYADLGGNSSFLADGAGNLLLRLPQDGSVRLATVYGNDCRDWWSGFLVLKMPVAAPADSQLLKATLLKPSTCRQL